jgi:hypothetical protein
VGPPLRTGPCSTRQTASIAGDLVGLVVPSQQTDVVAGDVVSQKRGLRAEDRFAPAPPVTVPVFGEPEEELAVMAAVGEVLDMSRHNVAVGPGHVPEPIISLGQDKAQKTGPKSEPCVRFQPPHVGQPAAEPVAVVRPQC